MFSSSTRLFRFKPITSSARKSALLRRLDVLSSSTKKENAKLTKSAAATKLPSSTFTPSSLSKNLEATTRSHLLPRSQRRPDVVLGQTWLSKGPSPSMMARSARHRNLSSSAGGEIIGSNNANNDEVSTRFAEQLVATIVGVIVGAWVSGGSSDSRHLSLPIGHNPSRDEGQDKELTNIVTTDNNTWWFNHVLVPGDVVDLSMPQLKRIEEEFEMMTESSSYSKMLLLVTYNPKCDVWQDHVSPQLHEVAKEVNGNHGTNKKYDIRIAKIDETKFNQYNAVTKNRQLYQQVKGVSPSTFLYVPGKKVIVRVDGIFVDQDGNVAMNRVFHRLIQEQEKFVVLKHHHHSNNDSNRNNNISDWSLYQYLFSK